MNTISRVVLILAIILQSSLFGIDFSTCDSNYRNIDKYLDSVMEEVYHSIVDQFEQVDKKLTFGKQRFPFRLTYRLDQHEQKLKQVLESSKPLELRKFKDMQQDFADRYSKVNESFPNGLNEKVLSLPNKEQITFYSESIFPLNSSFSIYSDMENLRILLKELIESPITTKDGIFHVTGFDVNNYRFKEDIKLGYETGWIHHGGDPDKWFEGPLHHHVLVRNSENRPLEEIASELNNMMTKNSNEKKNYWHFNANDIESFIRHEVRKIKKFREIGFTYFKNANGEQRINGGLIRNILLPMFKEGKDLESIVEKLNQASNQAPYNLYMFVPWTEKQAQKALSHLL